MHLPYSHPSHLLTSLHLHPEVFSPGEPFISQPQGHWRRWTPRSFLCFPQFLGVQLPQILPYLSDWTWLGPSTQQWPVCVSRTFQHFRWSFTKNENVYYCYCSWSLVRSKRLNIVTLFHAFCFGVKQSFSLDLMTPLIMCGPVKAYAVGTKGFLEYSNLGKHKYTKQKEGKLLSMCLVCSQSQQTLSAWINDCYYILTLPVPWHYRQNLCFYSVRCSG